MVKYSIYLLINPLTNDPFYVGCTLCTTTRFKSHTLNVCKRVLCKTKKDLYVAEKNIEPIFQIIETVEVNQSEHEYVLGMPKPVAELEAKWIEFFINEGYEMTNKKWMNVAA